MTCLTQAREGSAYIVTIAVEDQDGNDVTPKTAVWTILDSAGAVINSRKQIPITPLSASMEVCLSGDDLPCPVAPSCEITFIFEATYDTTVNGVAVSDKPIRETLTITVTDIPTIP